MTSCSEIEEETGEEDGKQENPLGEIEKTMAAMPIHLHWGQIFSLLNEMHQHMIAGLKHPDSLLTRLAGSSSEKMVYFQSAR